MKLTVMTADDRIFVIDVDPNEEVENVKALLEVETSMPVALQQLVFNGSPLLNGSRLDTAGVKDGDLFFLAADASSGSSRVGGTAMAAAAGPNLRLKADGSAEDPVAFRQHLLQDGDLISRLVAQDHPLGGAAMSEDVEKLQEVLRMLHEQKKDLERRQQEEMSLLTADPFDPEAQRKIEEAIRQRNVDDNYATAYEHNPEQFVAVHMLYVDMEVNNFPLKAFIDSGAQSTIMSRQCAERCGLMRLLDSRYKGVAHGVGQTAIVGRIHSVQLKIGRNYYICSITVLEAQNMEFLFGLDMLRRHQCCIDLKDSVLRVGGGEIAVPFLAEKDIPKKLLPGDFSGESSSLAEGGRVGGGEYSGERSAAKSAGEAALARAAAGAGRGAAAVPSSSAGRQEAAATQTNQVSGGTAAQVNEDKIQRLTDLGFTRTEAAQALEAAGGNEEHAVSLLFGG